MPQMAPINWLTLFFMFSFIFVLFCMVNYFNYYITYPLNNNNLMINKNNFFLNWKW